MAHDKAVHKAWYLCICVYPGDASDVDTSDRFHNITIGRLEMTDEIRMTITADEWKDLNRRGRRVMSSMEEGYEVRHDTTNGKIYIPADVRRWPENTRLVINDKDYGLPNKSMTHGHGWVKTGIIESAKEDTPEPSTRSQKRVDVEKWSHENLEARIESGESLYDEIKAWAIWTAEPTSYQEWRKIAETLFFIDAPFRRLYFKLKGYWYHCPNRGAKPRVYPKRHMTTWEDLKKAQREFYLVCDLYEKRWPHLKELLEKNKHTWPDMPK